MSQHKEQSLHKVDSMKHSAVLGTTLDAFSRVHWKSHWAHTQIMILLIFIHHKLPVTLQSTGEYRLTQENSH